MEVHSNKFAFHFGSRKTASSLFFAFQLQIFFVTAETKSCFFVCVAANLILLLQTCLSLIFAVAKAKVSLLNACLQLQTIALQ